MESPELPGPDSRLPPNISEAEMDVYAAHLVRKSPIIFFPRGPLRSAVFAWNSRPFVAATEIPNSSAVSLSERSCSS